MCAKYGSARQECATAGNFDHCIAVKMGDIGVNDIDWCSNDGSLAEPPNDMPSRLECAVFNFDKQFR